MVSTFLTVSEPWQQGITSEFATFAKFCRWTKKSELRLLMPLFGAKMFSVNYMNCYSNFYKLNYIYVQVRGPKYVVRLFAHEVADVEPVLGMLVQQNPQDHEVYNCFVWQLMVFLQPIIIAPSWMTFFLMILSFLSMPRLFKRWTVLSTR